MSKPKLGGMEERPLEGQPETSSPVAVITDDRMLDRCEVCSDLVGPPGFEPTLHQGAAGFGEAANNPVVGSGRFTPADDRSPGGITRRTSKRRINQTGIGFDVADNQRLVPSTDGAARELVDEVPGGLLRQGHHHQTRGAAVQTVDHTRPIRLGLSGCQLPQRGEPAQQSLNQRSIGDSGSGVDDQPGLLVDNDNVVIGVYDRHRYRRIGLQEIIGVDDLDDDDIVNINPLRWFVGNVGANGHVAGFKQGHGLTTAHSRRQGHDTVNALPGEGRGDRFGDDPRYAHPPWSGADDRCSLGELDPATRSATV